MAHPGRNTIRARLDLHVLAPAPKEPGKPASKDVVGDEMFFGDVVGDEMFFGDVVGTEMVFDGSVVGTEMFFGDVVGDELTFGGLPEHTARGRSIQTHPAADVAILPEIVPLSYGWTRNPLTVADTLSSTFNADDLPVDLQIIRGSQVRGWLYGHEQPKTCTPGQEGYFAGIVDKIERDRNAGRITIECRDYTAIPLNHNVSAYTLALVDLSQALPQIVEFLIHRVPGAEQWRVEGRGKVAALGAPKSFLAEERIEVVRKRQRTVTTQLEPSSDYGVGTVHVIEGPDRVATNRLRPVLEARGSSGISDPTDRAKYLRNSKQVEAYAEKHRVKITSQASRWLRVVTRETITPGKMRTRKIPPTAQTVFGSTSQNTWTAIVRLCSLMGCVPEVASWSDGTIGIVIVAADELQGGEILRPFQRTVEGQRIKHRVMIDGVDVFEMNERRELDAGVRVDFVEVVAADPDTGKTRRARFGRGGLEAGVDLTGLRARRPHGVTSQRGTFMAAHGITNQQHLERLAETAWRSLLEGEFKLEITSDVPWSHGGGPDDPDLVGLAAGAAVELRFRGLEGLAPERTGPGTVRESKAVQVRSIAFLSRFYMARGVPEKAARVFAVASLAKARSLVFQVVTVRHDFSGESDGSYRCQMNVQTFLSDGERPDIDETAWRDANDEAYESEQGDDEVFE